MSLEPNQIDVPQARPRVALFVTCLVDLMRPEVGFAAIRLLEHAGCEVVVPDNQTCCGQPAFNSGDRPAALRLAERVVRQLEGFDHIVIPSGSCAGMIKTHYAELLADDPNLKARMLDVSTRVYELTDYLVNVCGLDTVPSAAEGTITYHDCCSGLRELGVCDQPRTLLQKIPGISLVEMPSAQACCGFGGTFSLKYGHISAAIADEKIQAVQATGACAVVMGDVGCMLHLEGRLRRTGDERTQVKHVAEVLAGHLVPESAPGALGSAG